MKDGASWSKKELIRSLIYLSRHRAANSDSLAAYIDETIDIAPALVSGPVDAQIVAEALMSALKTRLDTALPTDEKAALRCAYWDIQRGHLELDEAAFKALSTSSSVEGYLEKFYAQILDAYADVGLYLTDKPALKIVESYPDPYSHFNSMALAPDTTDQKKYGIENAFFFRRERLSPFPSPIVLAHEIVHRFVSDDGLLARGLEEGIAEFMAYFIAGPRIFPDVVIDNFFISRRVSPEKPSKISTLYTAYLRQAVWLYQQVGIDGLVEIINRGRSFIKATEVAVSKGTLEELSLPRSKPDIACLNRAQNLAYLFPEGEVVSAQAFQYVLSRYEKMHVDSSAEELLPILREIETSVYGVVVSESGQVEFNDFRTLAKNRSFRYAVPTR